MPLTEQLISEYSNLINRQLDDMPIKSPKDYEQIIKVLSHFPDVTYADELPIDSEEIFYELKACYDSPQRYVDLPEEQAEFQSIIMNSIQRKVETLTSMSQAEREAYVSARLAARARAFQVRLTQMQSFLRAQLPELPDIAETPSVSDNNTDMPPDEYRLKIMFPSIERHVDCTFMYDREYEMITVNVELDLQSPITDADMQHMNGLFKYLTGELPLQSFTFTKLAEGQFSIKIHSDCPVDLTQDIYKLKFAFDHCLQTNALPEEVLDTIIERFDINAPPPCTL